MSFVIGVRIQATRHIRPNAVNMASYEMKPFESPFPEQSLACPELHTWAETKILPYHRLTDRDSAMPFSNEPLTSSWDTGKWARSVKCPEFGIRWLQAFSRSFQLNKVETNNSDE
jgi:hypothetical protein